jgi:hypothetical protein
MTRYVLANVQLPIRVDASGGIETMQQYAQIHVIKEILSPDEVEQNPYSIQEQVQNLFQKTNIENNQVVSTETNIMTISKEELSSGSRSSLKNTSFKNRKHYRHNATARQHK